MLLGLTGGIATGKSTFARMLSDKHSFITFDADACVHELLAYDPYIAEAIRHAFGAKAFTADGSIDRTALRGIIFKDPTHRQTLESILHPRVRACWEDIRTTCLRDGKDMLADIPLLFETNAQAAFDATILVAASQQTQEARMAGRGHDNATTQAMLASQWPLHQKIHAATVVVWNDGTQVALEHQADLLLESLFRPKA